MNELYFRNERGMWRFGDGMRVHIAWHVGKSAFHLEILFRVWIGKWTKDFEMEQDLLLRVLSCSLSFFFRFFDGRITCQCVFKYFPINAVFGFYIILKMIKILAMRGPWFTWGYCGMKILFSIDLNHLIIDDFICLCK